MKKHWIYYITGMLITFIALIFEENIFFLVLLITEFLTPLILVTLLKREAEYMKVSFLIKHARCRGRNLDVVIHIENKRRKFVSGAVKVIVQNENILYGDIKYEELLIPLINADNYSFTRPLIACGQKKITYQKVILYDIFGLSSVNLSVPQEQYITVYPQQKEIHLNIESVSKGWNDEGKQAENKMGKDISEIYDIKEYQAGDDIRLIHHNLTSKVGKIMVKHGSDMIDSDTIILFDAGLTSQKSGWRLKNALIETASSISGELIRQGINHYAALVTADGLSMFLIDSEEKRLEMITVWMSIHMFEETGKALELYRMTNYSIFSKFIYVTHGDLQEKSLVFDEKTDVIAICIEDSEEKKFQITEHDNYKVMQMSAGMIDSGELNLYM